MWGNTGLTMLQVYIIPAPLREYKPTKNKTWVLLKKPGSSDGLIKTEIKTEDWEIQTEGRKKKKNRGYDRPLTTESQCGGWMSVDIHELPPVVTRSLLVGKSWQKTQPCATILQGWEECNSHNSKIIGKGDEETLLFNKPTQDNLNAWNWFLKKLTNALLYTWQLKNPKDNYVESWWMLDRSPLTQTIAPHLLTPLNYISLHYKVLKERMLGWSKQWIIVGGHTI